MSGILALGLVGLIGPARCVGEEWSRFRGPRGDGYAEVDDAPQAWSDEEHVVWKTTVPGEGWSSPVVTGGQIFVTAAIPVDGGGYSLGLVQFDGESGRLTRQTEIFRQAADPSAPVHSKNSHASPTPLVEQGRVYVHFGHQGTACVDSQGDVLWRNRSLTYAPVHGNGGSPILVGQSLIFSCDGQDTPFVVALDRRDGHVLWKTERQSDATNKFSFSTPTLIDVDGQPQVVTAGSNVVNALDPVDGREIWRVRYDGYSVVPKPVWGHGLIFMSTCYNQPSLLAIRADGRGDVTATHVAWRSTRAAPHTPSPLLVGDLLFVVSDQGIATCLDAKTGRMRWRERLGGAFSASPIAADGKIYFLSEEGTTTVVAAAPEFSQISQNELGERTLASMGVLEGDLLIRTEKHLYRIGSP